MAVSRKGWRKIIVEKVQYYWRAAGTDGGINVVVVTQAAFTIGAKAQQLLFRLGYDELRTPIGNDAVSLHQRAAVTPGVIRAAIEAAIQPAIGFSGEVGSPDVRLSGEALTAVQQRSRASEA